MIIPAKISGTPISQPQDHQIVHSMPNTMTLKTIASPITFATRKANCSRRDEPKIEVTGPVLDAPLAAAPQRWLLSTRKGFNRSGARQ
jgi:hypothetical protein